MPADEMTAALAALMRETEVGHKMLVEAFESIHSEPTPDEPEPFSAPADDTYAPLPGLTLKPLGVVGHSRAGGDDQ